MAQRIICMIDLKSNICSIFCKSKHYTIFAWIFHAKDSIGSGIKNRKRKWFREVALVKTWRFKNCRKYLTLKVYMPLHFQRLYGFPMPMLYNEKGELVEWCQDIASIFTLISGLITTSGHIQFLKFNEYLLSKCFCE